MKRLPLVLGALILIILALLWHRGSFDSFQKDTGGSIFTLSSMENGEWVSRGQHDFEVEYSTHSFIVPPSSDEVRVRLSQEGGDFADLEQVTASSCNENHQHLQAFYTDTEEDILSDIMADDNNVIIIHDREIEIVWQPVGGCPGDITIEVTANAYGHAHPFRYPEEGTISYTMGDNQQRLTIDGFVDEVDGLRDPDHSPLWEPVTGHPDGETHIYISDDEEALYIALDITMDNTDEIGEDFAEVVVFEGEKETTFRIDDENDDYGICAFGETSKVTYKHQTCEFRIPKDIFNSENIKMAIRYYGTGGGPPPVGDWDLDVTDPLPITLFGHSAVTYDNKIYVFGGFSFDLFDMSDSVYIYDPSQPPGSRWSEDTTDPMPGKRQSGGAVLVGGNIYYLLGRSIPGDNAFLEEEVFIYDPDGADGARWSSGTSIGAPDVRQSFGYAAEGTDIYIIGGMDNEAPPTFYDDVFKYDTLLDTWDTTTLTPMPVARGRITAQNVAGSIYVAGGDSADLRLYIPFFDSWSSGPAFPGSYDPIAPCSAKYGDDFYVIGHYDEVETYKFNDLGGTWTQTENLNRVRMRCSAVELNGTLYTIGGYDDDGGEDWDDFETLTVAQLPTAPTANYPDDGSTRAGVVVLSAQYDHTGGTPGSTDYRVSTSSASDCVDDINIEASATSAAVAADEPTFVNIGTLSNGTKYWCARNDDGTNQSAWTSLGTFEQDSGAPYLSYGSYFGGSDNDTVVSNVVFYNDEIYVAGNTQSADFPVTGGAYDQTRNTTSSGFIAKFQLDGSGATDLIASTFFEPLSSINDLFVDSTGVYVVGQTNDGAFPTAGGAGGTPFDSTWNNGASSADSFISRFNLSLSSLEYSTFFGGTTFDQASDLFVESGTVYVAGLATTDFPTTVGAYDDSYSGTGFNAYYAAFSLAGNGATDLLYSTYFGNDDVFTNDLYVDSGVMYVGGWVDNSGQEITPGAFDSVKAGFGQESYLVAFEPLGAELIYATYVGGSSSEAIRRLVYDDASGNIIACGNTNSGDFFTTPGAYDSLSSSAGFVIQLDPAGNTISDMIYSSYLGTGSQSCTGLAYSGGDVFMTLGTGFNFDTTSDAYANETFGQAIMRMNLGGNGPSDRVYASFIGSNELSLAADGNTMYMAGSTGDKLFPILADPGGTPFNSTLDTNGDGALLRMEFSGGVPSAPLLTLDAVGSGEVDLSLVPGADNGSPHTDFIWQFKEATSGVWNTFPDGVSTDTSLTLTGLTNGVLYDFQAAGENSSGVGAFSNVVQGTPLGTGRRRLEFPTGGAFFFFGSVPNTGSFQSFLDLSTFVDRTSNAPTFYGAAESDPSENNFNPNGDPLQESNTGATSFENFSIEEYLASNLNTDNTDTLFLLDLVIALQWLTEFRKQDQAYELLRPNEQIAEELLKVFRTRWFHQLAGVDYLERINKVDYGFDYRFPIENETEIVVFMMRSVLLTFGRSCFTPAVLEYAEEVDVPGEENEFWYYRYFQIMKPWMDTVLGEKGYQVTRSAGDIDALDAIFILLHQFCLGDGFSSAAANTR